MKRRGLQSGLAGWRCGAILAVLLTISGAGSGLSGQEQRGSEFLLFSEIPVVVAATRRAERLDKTPAFVTVITRKEIRQSGARTLPELLRRVPELDVFYQSDGSYEMGLQGLAEDFSHKILLLRDGQPFVSGLRGGLILREQPIVLHDVERVEVIRGPVAAVHGSNAFTGAINIVTRQAGSGRPVEAWASAADGGQFFQGVRASDEALGGRFGLVLQHEKTGGFGPPVTPALEPVPGFEGTDPFDRHTATGVYEAELGESTSLRLDGALQNHDSSASMAPNPIFGRSLARTRRYGATVTHRWGRHTSRFRALRDIRQIESDAFRPPLRGDPRRFLRYGYWDLDLQNAADHGRHQLVYGLTYRSTEASGFLLSPGAPDVERVSGYLEWNSELTDKLGTTASVLALDQGDNPLSTGVRLAARYDVTEDDTLRLGYGSAFRSPDPILLHFIPLDRLANGATVSPPLFAGDPGIDDELIETLQLALEHRDSRGAFGLELYRSQVEDYVDLVPAGFGVTVQPFGPTLPIPVTRFGNDPLPRESAGLLLTARRRLTRTLDGKAFWRHQDVRNVDGSPQLSFAAPRRREGLNLTWAVGDDDSFDLFWSHVSSYLSPDIETGLAKRVPGYGTVDVAFRHVTGPERSVTLAVSNLLDNRHVELLSALFTGDPGPGVGVPLERRVSVEVQWGF